MPLLCFSLRLSSCSCTGCCGCQPHYVTVTALLKDNLRLGGGFISQCVFYCSDLDVWSYYIFLITYLYGES